MTELHVQVDTVLWVIGGSACTALVLARLVVMAYDDLRRTWKKVADGRDHRHQKNGAQS